jgi:hypothetical protein
MASETTRASTLIVEMSRAPPKLGKAMSSMERNMTKSPADLVGGEPGRGSRAGL